MKKIALGLVMALLSITLSSKAQTQQGNVLVGADFARFSFQLNNPHQFDVSLSPSAAWFLNNNFALGGYVNFALSATSGYNTTTTVGLGPLARYYFGKAETRSKLFLQANAGYSNSSYGTTSTISAVVFGAGPGFAYFVTPNVGLETILSYNGASGTNTYTGYGHSVNLNFGLQVYLEGHKSKK